MGFEEKLLENMMTPPVHQKVCRVLPFFHKIIEMTPPQKKKTKQKEERFLFLFVNVDTVLYSIQLLKQKTPIFDAIKGVAIRAMKFEAVRIHFLGDVLDAVAVFFA